VKFEVIEPDDEKETITENMKEHKDVTSTAGSRFKHIKLVSKL
jgi:hypothetical protein